MKCMTFLENLGPYGKLECKCIKSCKVKLHIVNYVFYSGNTPETRGTAFVVYEDIFDAKNACDHLSGFNVCNRYLVVLYYQSNKAFKRLDVDKKQEELNNIKSKYNLKTPEAP